MNPKLTFLFELPTFVKQNQGDGNPGFARQRLRFLGGWFAYSSRENECQAFA